MRVLGWQTHLMRNESEGLRRRAEVIILFTLPGGGIHHRPIANLVVCDSSESTHVGTRKMVNYAWAE